jgi:hypothetical protein
MYDSSLEVTDWKPIGWQGPVQHTWTRTCDGLHGPGPCPDRQLPVIVTAAV